MRFAGITDLSAPSWRGVAKEGRRGGRKHREPFFGLRFVRRHANIEHVENSRSIWEEILAPTRKKDCSNAEAVGILSP